METNFVSSTKFTNDIKNRDSKINFMVDTGASLSILPLSIINGIMIDPTPVSLSTDNKDKINCFGQADLEIGIPSLSFLGLS